jgi:hypothetical protein
MGRVEAQNQNSSTRETTMRVAYLTTDEVNRELALEMADKCGLTLCPLEPRNGPPTKEYDAILYDWDSWPAEQRQETLAALLAGPLPHAVALHGYGLEDDQVETLRRHTIAVYRRLQPRAFRFLRRAVRVVRAARSLFLLALSNQSLERQRRVGQTRRPRSRP